MSGVLAPRCGGCLHQGGALTQICQIQVMHVPYRLPKKLLFGEVKGLRPPGRPRSSFNDVALCDCQNCLIGRPYRDAQDGLLWRDKTCLART